MRKGQRTPVPAPVAVIAEAAVSAAVTGYRAGRRAAHRAAGLGRRAGAGVADSSRRASVALQVYRGGQYAAYRRPAEYVTVGVVGGVVLAAAYGALAQFLAGRPAQDGGPGPTRPGRPLDALREAVGRVTGGQPTPESCQPTLRPVALAGGAMPGPRHAGANPERSAA